MHGMHQRMLVTLMSQLNDVIIGVIGQLKLYFKLAMRSIHNIRLFHTVEQLKLSNMIMIPVVLSI